MKLVDTVIVFDQGSVSDSPGWKKAHAAYAKAIQGVEHPPGSGVFRIRPKQRKLDARGRSTGQWARNGVNPIKARFQNVMERLPGWKREEPLSLDEHLRRISSAPWISYPTRAPYAGTIHSRVGHLDFWGIIQGQRVAIEWETGNISSSHRSMNKLCLALMAGLLDACVLIVPSRELYRHLTDRIGNWQELGPYLSFWKSIGELGVRRGLLAISIVEHDELVVDDPSFPFISAGTDGRSAEGRRKGKSKARSR